MADEASKGPSGEASRPTGAGGVSMSGGPASTENAAPGQSAKAAGQQPQAQSEDPKKASLGQKAAAMGAGGVVGGAMAKNAAAAEGTSGLGAAKGVTGGAFQGANVASKAQNLKNDPNLTNAVKLAGTVDKRLAVAGAAMGASKKVGEETGKLVDSTKEDSDSGDSKKDADQMGAGGTSAQPKGKDTDGTVGGGKGGKVAAGVAGGGAAAAAGPLMMLLLILQWLKSLFMAFMQMLVSWLTALFAWIGNLVMAVVGFFTAIGAAISGFVGGAVSVTAAATSSFMAAVMFVAGVLSVGIGSYNAGEAARRDAPLVNCVAGTNAIQEAVNIANMAGNAQTEANAQKVYSILAGMGMSDVNVAGILGNWTAESGVDPTGVETIYDEKFVIGPRKQSAQAVNFRIDDYNPAYGATYPAIEFAGIGLGQWTNGRNTMLREYSELIGKPWHLLETQLGFMVSKDDPTRVAYIKSMISTEAPSVDQATSDFMTKWEGLSLGVGNLGDRQSAAAQWYAKMSGWTKDTALAQSILAQSGTAVMAGNNAAVSAALTNCRTAKTLADNSSLAMAALSYAWPTRNEGVGNNGTPLYQELHDHIFPGDPYYMSCDRGVATAVRWSGTDDGFPAGPVPTQMDHLTTSPKWEEIMWGGDETKLQPGDILIRWDGGHIELYVGHELASMVFTGQAGPQTAMVSASYGERSDGRSPAATNFYTGGSRGLDTYRAFRSTGKEPMSQYASYVPTNSPMGNATGNVAPGGSIPVSR